MLDGGAGEAGGGDAVLAEHGGVGEGADAEIDEARARFAVGAVEDEDVGRFDVLVQDADAVRGGQGGGGVGDERDALRERDVVEAALVFGPLEQVAVRGEVAFQIERRGVELEFVDVDDVVALAEGAARAGAPG